MNTLTTEERLRKALQSYATFVQFEGSRGMNIDESIEDLLALINEERQQTLNKVKAVYMQLDYEGSDDDMIQEIIKVTETELQTLSQGGKK